MSYGSLIATVTTLTEEIQVFNSVISRKLALAAMQLQQAKSVEEFQQIGIITRDALIEFGQSIFQRDMLPDNTAVPSNSDAKALTDVTMKYYDISDENLKQFLKTCLGYSNAIQHDTSVKKEAAFRALCMTTLFIALAYHAIAQSPSYKTRPYYKCPNCGGLNLVVKEYVVREVDYAWKTDKLVCLDCGWFYIQELGGVTGIE
jgi:hypothetical protein